MSTTRTARSRSIRSRAAAATAVADFLAAQQRVMDPYLVDAERKFVSPTVGGSAHVLVAAQRVPPHADRMIALMRAAMHGHASSGSLVTAAELRRIAHPVRLIWGRVPGRRTVRAGPGPRLPTRRLDPWRTSADRHARQHDAGPLTFLAVLARQSLQSSFPWTGCGGSTRWRTSSSAPPWSSRHRRLPDGRAAHRMRVLIYLPDLGGRARHGRAHWSGLTTRPFASTQGETMSTQHIDTVIIGAGQAGLSTGYHLQRLGREFLIVDGNARIGDNWRHHYDSLTLFTPAKLNGLDGLPFPGDPWRFPCKDEMADYLELYAVTFNLPVRMQTRVNRIAARDEGGFIATVGESEIACDNVVISTGTFGRTPSVPAFAAELDPRIQQLHSSQYRRPSQLADGPTLVVGASHSGLDIAYEIGADRPTVLVGPNRGQIPLEWGSRRLRAAFPLIEFAFTHVLTRRTPMGRKTMQQIRHHGAPQLRVKRHHLVERGVEWVEDHVAGVSEAGLPRLANGRTFDVANVVWATGFRQVYDWIDLPLEIKDGWPVEYRGVVDSVPGIFFCGLAFQYAFASGEVNGVGRDAAYVAKKIMARTAAQAPVAA